MMNLFKIQYLRLLIFATFLLIIGNLFSQVFFLVTNSNYTDLLPDGQSQVNFEQNELELISWELSGDSNWELDSTYSYLGLNSIKSGEITDNQFSNITITIDVYESGPLEFYYKVDSEYSVSGDYFYDGLEFYVNGELLAQFQPNTDGESNWTYINYPLEVGVHTITWSYTKDDNDGATESELDAAWIDEITFPPSNLTQDFAITLDPQDMSSGLFSAFVHPLNNEYSKMKAKGGTFADFDLDGDLDLFYGYTQTHYFENKGSHFVELTDEIDINESGIRGVVVGDIDNNGYPDILKWRYYFDTDRSHFALLNFGNHYFETTRYLDSSLMENLHSQGLIDVDLDGDLDIVAVEKEGDTQFYCYLNQGLDENGNPIYELAFSFDRDDDDSSSRTLAIADYDGDGDQDVFIPRKGCNTDLEEDEECDNNISGNWLFENQYIINSMGNLIYQNSPENIFLEKANELILDDSAIDIEGSSGYGAAWGDYDNDSDFDLYLSNWGKNRLYRNDNGQFINVAETLNLESDSLSNGAGWGDFNNDGLLDLWAANFKREDDVYINNGTESWDNSFNPLFMSATQDVIAADYNNDGLLDMFTPGLQMAHGNGPDGQGYKYTSLLFENILQDSTSNSNSWIKIDLEGSQNGFSNNGWSIHSNKSAIGAKVIIETELGTYFREIIAGKGHGSMDPLQLHFGLGSSLYINNITIKWPSLDTLTNQAKITSFDGPIELNKGYKIVEDIGFVGLKGDVNNDQFVNVIDVVQILQEILYNYYNFSESQFWGADIDYSNQLDVLDLTKLVEFILLHL